MTSSFYHDSAPHVLRTDFSKRDGDVDKISMTPTSCHPCHPSGDESGSDDTLASIIGVNLVESGKAAYVFGGIDASWWRRHLISSSSGDCTASELDVVRRISWSPPITAAKEPSGRRPSFTINAILGLDDDDSRLSNCGRWQRSTHSHQACFGDGCNWVSRADRLEVEGGIEMCFIDGRQLLKDIDEDSESTASVQRSQHAVDYINDQLDGRYRDDKCGRFEDCHDVIDEKTASSSDIGCCSPATAPPSGKHGKRVRTIYTQEQLERLESEFEKQQYMVGTERYFLASELGLVEAQVKVWFQNRRIKWRRQTVESHRHSRQRQHAHRRPMTITAQAPTTAADAAVAATVVGSTAMSCPDEQHTNVSSNFSSIATHRHQPPANNIRRPGVGIYGVSLLTSTAAVVHWGDSLELRPRCRRISSNNSDACDNSSWNDQVVDLRMAV